jgi:hypothetical protein
VRDAQPRVREREVAHGAPLGRAACKRLARRVRRVVGERREEGPVSVARRGKRRRDARGLAQRQPRHRGRARCQRGVDLGAAVGLHAREARGAVAPHAAHAGARRVEPQPREHARGRRVRRRRRARLGLLLARLSRRRRRRAGRVCRRDAPATRPQGRRRRRPGSSRRGGAAQRAQRGRVGSARAPPRQPGMPLQQLAAARSRRARRRGRGPRLHGARARGHRSGTLPPLDALLFDWRSQQPCTTVQSTARLAPPPPATRPPLRCRGPSMLIRAGRLLNRRATPISAMLGPQLGQRAPRAAGGAPAPRAACGAPAAAAAAWPSQQLAARRQQRHVCCMSTAPAAVAAEAAEQQQGAGGGKVEQR